VDGLQASLLSVALVVSGVVSLVIAGYRYGGR
jgi:hypothetical protein